MGRECLDRLAEPLVGGVNGSDPKDMSLAATYPMLLDMEQKHGSLIRGFLEQRNKVEEMRKKYPPKPGAPSADVLLFVQAGTAVPHGPDGRRRGPRQHPDRCRGHEPRACRRRLVARDAVDRARC